MPVSTCVPDSSCRLPVVCCHTFLTPLECACRESLPLSPAIRDIHHDHVLFSGDQVTGLVDFGILRIDTPLADMARLVGSLVADDEPARKFALDIFGTAATV